MRMTDPSTDMEQSVILCALIPVEKGLEWRSSMGLSSEIWAPINPTVDTSSPVLKLSDTGHDTLHGFLWSLYQ